MAFVIVSLLAEVCSLNVTQWEIWWVFAVYISLYFINIVIWHITTHQEKTRLTDIIGMTKVYVEVDNSYIQFWYGQVKIILFPVTIVIG